MSGKSEVLIRFLGDTKSLDRAMKSAHDGLSHVGTRTVALGSAMGFLAAGGLTTVASKMVGLVKEAQAAEAAQRITAQVIKTTGGAANVTAAQVDDLATAISNKTGVDDDAVRSGENLLLTFTGIRNEVGKGNDIFNQATQTVTDMSVALGQDTKSSAIQLGKALNDPIKGITALQRVGVSFTDAQKKQIAGLVAHGKTLEAQKVILHELGREFGGAAAAASDPMQKLGTIMDNTGKTVMELILPALEGAAGFITNNVVPAIQDLISGFEEGNVSETFFGGIGDAIFQVWGKVSSFFTTTLVPAFKAISGFIVGTLWPALVKLAGFVMTSVVPTIQSLAAGFIKNVWPALVTVAGFVTGTLVPAIIGLARGFMENVWPAIKTVVGIVVSNLQPAIVELATFWTGTLYPAIVRIIPFVAKVATVLGIVAGVVLVVASWLIGKLVPAIALVIGWVVNIASTFLSMVGNVIGYGLNFIGWFIKLPGKIGDAIAGLWDGLKNGFKAALNWIIDRWNSFPKLTIPGIDIGPIHYGGGTLGLPTLPHLANGGIVSKPTIALIGEAGPEAVVPLSRGRGRGGMGGGDVYHITINGPTDPLGAAQAVRQALVDLKRRTGTDLGLA